MFCLPICFSVLLAILLDLNKCMYVCKYCMFLNCCDLNGAIAKTMYGQSTHVRVLDIKMAIQIIES